MKSATVARIVPKTTANTALALTFSHAELALISEALRIASEDIAANAANLERVYPTSPLIERTRIYAESMKDIRDRIGLD